MNILTFSKNKYMSINTKTPYIQNRKMKSQRNFNGIKY